MAFAAAALGGRYFIRQPVERLGATAARIRSGDLSARSDLPDRHSELGRLGVFRLLPGMQAEVFIQTQTRTPLQYLIKPLRDQIARSFRER